MKYQIQIGDYKGAHEVLAIIKKMQLKNLRTEASDYENNVIFLVRQ
jgi:hypothetical protein